MIGSRLLPCRHQRARKIPDGQPGVYERTCATCDREFYAMVRRDAYWSQRLGGDSYKITWHEVAQEKATA